MDVGRGLIRRGAVAALGTTVLAGGSLIASEAAAADLASEPPQQIMQDVASALRGAKGYEMHFNLHKPSGESQRGEIIRAAHGGFYMKASLQPRQSIGLILVGGHAYFKASPSFWTSHGVSQSLAKVFAPRWYRYPTSEASKLKRQLGNITPSVFAQCLATDSPSQASVSTGTLSGRPVIILKSAGGEPGTAPGRITIAATGTPYPLRIVQTGPTSAGGPVNRCNDGKADNTTGTLTMSHWDSPPVVKPPAHAVKLPGN